MSDEEPLAGITVGVTAERRADQQIGLLERRGAIVRWGPVLQSVDLSGDERLAEVTRRVIEDPPDVLVVLTGQGASWWFDAADTAGLGGELRRALAGTEVLARGPKAASAAKRVGLSVAWQSARELVADVLEHLAPTVAGRSVAVQLDGADDADTVASVAALSGRPCLAVPVYRWALPADPGPADDLIAGIIGGEVHAVTFTASPAVRQLAQLAERLGVVDQLDHAFRRRVRAVCVGPVCAASARERGWAPVIEPERARLVPMIDALVEAVQAGVVSRG